MFFKSGLAGAPNIFTRGTTPTRAGSRARRQSGMNYARELARYFRVL